jgi:hypothetical protein
MIKNMALNIIIIDEQCQKNFTEIINKYKNRILLAGVSSMTGYQINRAIKFSKKIKKMSGCLVIWGGWHPTLLPKQVL